MNRTKFLWEEAKLPSGIPLREFLTALPMDLRQAGGFGQQQVD